MMCHLGIACLFITLLLSGCPELPSRQLYCLADTTGALEVLVERPALSKFLSCAQFSELCGLMFLAFPTLSMCAQLAPEHS